MPSYKPPKAPKPIEIDKFLGLNESVGETEIKLGESVYSRNFRITNNFKAQKREGHQTFIDFDNSNESYLVWHGRLGANNIMLVANNGNMYEYDLDAVTTTTAIADLITEGTVVLIGTLTDAETRGFYFQNIDDPTPYIYMFNGTDFKQWDGTTFQDVAPYVPTVAINAPPAGGGTLFEEVNLLTGTKSQSFIGDGSSTLYQLAELAIDADAVTATIDGVAKTEGVDFTVNRTLGQVTWTVAPALDSEVIITWVKVIAGNLELVTKNRFFMDFGPGNDTNMFLWGNPDAQDRRMRSGVLRANYYPVNNFTLIGTGQFAINSITQVYNRQLIFTEGAAYSSIAEFNTTTNKYEYPVTDLNERVGMVAPGQGQMVDNKPITLFANQIKEWVSQTTVEDERNENTVSDKIKQSLLSEDLTTAVTFDYQKENEYWVNIGSLVYVWNYFNDTFYMFDNINGNSFREVSGVPYYGAVGTVEKFDNTTTNDNGGLYTARMELGFTDFGVPTAFKTSRKCWVGIEPASRTGMRTFFATNKVNVAEAKELKQVKYVLFDFENIDFADFSFETNRNPQTKPLKMRTGKYTTIKMIFVNDQIDETLILLNFSIKAEVTGEV